MVYAKRPFAGPQAVLAYLSRYTHRVAISNSRLLAMDERGVTFRWKDYRAKGKTRHKAMTLSPQEFIRRFLLHVLPGGGLAPDGSRWVACRPGFFLSVRVLSRLFRRRFLEELQLLHDSGALRFFGAHAALAECAAFKDWLAPLRKCEWVV